MIDSDPELPDYMTPLYFAVSDGNFLEAKRLLAAGHMIESQPVDDGHSLLHVACENENAETVRFLLSQGGQRYLNSFDYVSCTPLMWAARKGHVEIANLLLDAGADINANHEERIGNTAIREAVREGKLEMVELLLQRGADPKVPGWMQIDAIMEARDQFDADPGSEIRRKIYEILSSHTGQDLQQ